MLPHSEGDAPIIGKRGQPQYPVPVQLWSCQMAKLSAKCGWLSMALRNRR